MSLASALIEDLISIITEHKELERETRGNGHFQILAVLERLGVALSNAKFSLEIIKTTRLF